MGSIPAWGKGSQAVEQTASLLPSIRRVPTLSLLVSSCKPENLILRAVPPLPFVPVFLYRPSSRAGQNCPRCRQGLGGTRHPQGWRPGSCHICRPGRTARRVNQHHGDAQSQRADSPLEGCGDAIFGERQLQSAAPALCLFPHLDASSAFRGGRTGLKLRVSLRFVCFLSLELRSSCVVWCSVLPAWLSIL